ncbi:MAG: hypothetical protein GY730_09080 [bacterium]|nr:hypothetical protein [bacterium]
MSRFIISAFLIYIQILGFNLLAAPEEINYSYFGNYKALVNIPDKKGRMPVIIYNYDEYYDWAGKELAKKNG